MTSTYTVERSTTIDAAPDRVYPHVVDFHRWTAWSPWEDVDPALRREYSGPGSGEGSAYTWEGNRKAGKGRMRIVGATEPSSVEIDLAFEKPFRSESRTTFRIVPAGAGSTVTWTMTGRQNALMRVLSVVMPMDKLIGPDFEKGLARLKSTVESSAASPT